jgi:hypothetical protein
LSDYHTEIAIKNGLRSQLPGPADPPFGISATGASRFASATLSNVE